VDWANGKFCPSCIDVILCVASPCILSYYRGMNECVSSCRSWLGWEHWILLKMINRKLQVSLEDQGEVIRRSRESSLIIPEPVVALSCQILRCYWLASFLD
jgi:hypothetical protein